MEGAGEKELIANPLIARQKKSLVVSRVASLNVKYDISPGQIKLRHIIFHSKDAIKTKRKKRENQEEKNMNRLKCAKNFLFEILKHCIDIYILRYSINISMENKITDNDIYTTIKEH